MTKGQLVLRRLHVCACKCVYVCDSVLFVVYCLLICITRIAKQYKTNVKAFLGRENR